MERQEGMKSATKSQHMRERSREKLGCGIRQKGGSGTPKWVNRMKGEEGMRPPGEGKRGKGQRQ